VLASRRPRFAATYGVPWRASVYELNLRSILGQGMRHEASHKPGEISNLKRHNLHSYSLENSALRSTVPTRT
jgi:hypothetical protein